MKTHNKIMSAKGFTLVEALVSIGLLGLLASAGMKLSENFGKQTLSVRSQGEIRNLERELEFEFTTNPVNCKDNLNDAFKDISFATTALGSSQYKRILDVNGNVLVEDGKWKDNKFYISDLNYKLSDIMAAADLTPPYNYQALFTVSFYASFCIEGGINCDSSKRKRKLIKLEDVIIFLGTFGQIKGVECQSDEMFLIQQANEKVENLLEIYKNTWNNYIFNLQDESVFTQIAYDDLKRQVCNRETNFIIDNGITMTTSCGYNVSGSPIVKKETYGSQTFISDITFTLPAKMVTGSLSVLAIGAGGSGGNGIDRSDSEYRAGSGGRSGRTIIQKLPTITGGSKCKIDIGKAKLNEAGGSTTVTCGGVTVKAAGGMRGTDGGYITGINGKMYYPGEAGESARFSPTGGGITTYPGGIGAYHDALKADCFSPATPGSIGAGGGGGGAGYPICYPGNRGGYGAVQLRWTVRN